MLVALDTAYTDTTAADLRFALDLPAQPALRELAVPLPGGALLTLRLLGASHQVTLCGTGGDLTETVACLGREVHGGALPARVRRSRYTFDSTVRRLGRAEFTDRVGALRARAERGLVAGEHVLAGEFPGTPGALTVLAATRGSGAVSWWTAHAYPQTGELVLTRTAAGGRVP